MNEESKYLKDCMPDMLNSLLEFTQKFFNILNTNLISQSTVINNMLVNLGHNLFENKYLVFLSLNLIVLFKF